MVPGLSLQQVVQLLLFYAKIDRPKSQIFLGEHAPRPPSVHVLHASICEPNII